jgi:anti-anti-sigma factor
MKAPRTVVTLCGELDVYRAEAVREAFDSVRDAPVVDLSAVTYLDSTVLNELIRLRKRVDGEIVLVVGSPQIRRVLELVSFARLFRIVDHLTPEL